MSRLHVVNLQEDRHTLTNWVLMAHTYASTKYVIMDWVNGLVVYWILCHFMTKWWLIIHLTLRNIFQWKFDNFFLQIFCRQNAYESVLRMKCPPFCSSHGPHARYVNLRVAHAPGIPVTFSPPPRVSDPDMHHGTCVTHVPWCISGSLTSGWLWCQWRGKRSRHSRCMRNLQFYVSGKRPITFLLCHSCSFNVSHYFTIWCVI